MSRLNTALSSYENSRDELGQAEVLDSIGRTESEGDPSSAVAYWQKAAEIYTRLGKTAEVAELYGNMCAILIGSGNAEDSVKFCQEAIKKIGTLRAQGDSVSSFLESRMGQANWLLGDLTNALRSYESGAGLEDKYYRPFNLYGIGKVYRSLGDIGKARDYYERARAELPLNSRHTEATDLSSDLGEIYAIAGDLEKAITENEAALTRSRRTNSVFANLSYSESEILSKIADLYLRSGDFENAAVNVQEAEELLNFCGTQGWRQYRHDGIGVGSGHGKTVAEICRLPRGRGECSSVFKIPIRLCLLGWKLI